MQSRALEQYFADLSPRTESELDQIARALREADMMPSGARGPHAPKLKSSHAANFIIGAAMAEKASDAPAAVKLFGALMPTTPLSMLPKSRSGYNFVRALAGLLDLPIYIHDINEVRFFRPPPDKKYLRSMAVIEIQWTQASGRGRTLFLPAKNAALSVESARPSVGGTMQFSTVIGGEMLYEIGNGLVLPSFGIRGT